MQTFVHNKVISRLSALLVLFILANGCSNKKLIIPADTPTSGDINISADESFKPVIDEQVKVFEGSYPNAKINVHYKPEAECLKDLLSDSATRMVIVTRGLGTKEEHYMEDSLGYTPRWDKVATDAIAVVVNINAPDTVFTLETLQQRLTGKMGNKQKIIFDGMSATSTVRFAIDSILKGKKFDTSVVKAVQNSNDVLDFIATDINAIGLVGISWIGNPEDSAQVNMLKKVKMAFVKCTTCTDSPYVKPSQLSILTHRYPLVRGLYYILKENYNGLGSGFADFLQYERGQLIFKRAYLGSSKIGFAIRNVKINKTLVK